MDKVKYFLEKSWLLMACSLMFGLLLSGLNAGLAERITTNQQERLKTKVVDLFDDANSIEALTPEPIVLQTDQGAGIKTMVYCVKDANRKACGLAFTATGSGFADKITLVIATDAAFKRYLGYDVLACNETPTLGDCIKKGKKKDKYRRQYLGIPVGPLTLTKTGDFTVMDNEIVAITGATVSSKAVVTIFNTYWEPIRSKAEQEGWISK